MAQSLSKPTPHNNTAHRLSDLNLCSARVLPAPPTAETQSRAWGEEREGGAVGGTSVVQVVRARAPCVLPAGEAFFYLFFVICMCLCLRAPPTQSVLAVDDGVLF